MKRFCFLALFGLGAMGLFPLAAPLASQEKPDEGAASKLSIAAVHVEPAQPAADTLCRLRVEIKNDDERIASQLGFDVTINGQQLPVYGNHLFMFPVSPGGTSELALYNFWSTETSRPLPASGKLEVEVTLREARWMDISDEDGTEVWTPLGDATGLPVSASVTLKMAKSAGAE